MDPDIFQLIDDLETKIPEWKEKHKIDGFTVAITGASGKLWSQGYGIADHEETPVTSNTLFMIGSLSKAYTATAFLRAVQAGLVELDDRLIDYYPEFNWKTRFGGEQREKITFRHLLTHWAGLQHNCDTRLPNGQSVEFTKKSMILPDGVYHREEPSAERIKKLMRDNPTDCRLHESSLDSLINILEQTGRSEEANRIKELVKEKP